MSECLGDRLEHSISVYVRIDFEGLTEFFFFMILLIFKIAVIRWNFQHVLNHF